MEAALGLQISASEAECKRLQEKLSITEGERDAVRSEAQKMQLAHGAKVAALGLQISALETERDEMQGRLRTTEGERDAARSEARRRNVAGSLSNAAARTRDGARHAEQVEALESQREELEVQLRTTENERDAARSEARVRNFEIAVARKGRGDLRKAEAVDVLEETTDAGNASELQDEI